MNNHKTLPLFLMLTVSFCTTVSAQKIEKSHAAVKATTMQTPASLAFDPIDIDQIKVDTGKIFIYNVYDVALSVTIAYDAHDIKNYALPPNKATVLPLNQSCKYLIYEANSNQKDKGKLDRNGLYDIYFDLDQNKFRIRNSLNLRH